MLYLDTMQTYNEIDDVVKRIKELLEKKDEELSLKTDIIFKLKETIRMNDKKHGFYNGMLAALAVVVAFDQETLYREIVGTANQEELISAALSDEGTAEWAGLVKYGYCKAK